MSPQWNRINPYRSPEAKGERSTARRIDGGAGRRSERKRMLLCNGADNLAEQDFIRQAFKCLFSTQEKVGTWRHYAPLFHYPHAVNAYCYVFETFATILREALRPEADFVRNILKEYFTEIVRLWQYATSTKTNRQKGGLAWSSGHINKPNLDR